jgi:hypothetical protein
MSFVEVVKEGTMNRPHGKLSEGARKEEDKGMGEDHKNFHREGDFRRPQRQEGGGRTLIHLLEGWGKPKVL